MNVTQFSQSSEHIVDIEKHVFFTFCEHFDLKLQYWVQMNISRAKMFKYLINDTDLPLSWSDEHGF